MKCVYSIIPVLLFICLTGCESKYPPDWPKTYPCTITVTKGGQPYEGVTVLMSRTENHGAWAVSGMTDASGVAVIETSWTKAASKGAPEGKFKVTASKAAPPPEQIPQAEYEAMPYDQRTALLAANAAKSRNNPLIPQSLADPGKSQVFITVEPGTPATLSIEVDDFH